MPIKSTAYLNLTGDVKNLKAQLNLEAAGFDLIRKSEDRGPLTKIVTGLSTAMGETKKAALNVYGQFKALRQDKINNAINAAEYKERLKPLYDLLVNTKDKIDIEGFPTAEISAELKAAGYK